MKKEQLVAQLEAAKALTSVVSIDNVIALIQQLDPEVRIEKVSGMSRELAEEIADKIERRLDYNSSDLFDMSSAEFQLDYDNRIELTRVDINVQDVMDHITAAMDYLVIEEDEEQVEAEQAESEE